MRISDWSSDVCSSDLFDDPVIEIAITPNRGDCLGVRGVARDLAAAGLGPLKPLQAATVRGHLESPIAWRRDLPADRQHACPHVAGRSFGGTRNGDRKSVGSGKSVSVRGALEGRRVINKKTLTT